MAETSAPSSRSPGRTAKQRYLVIVDGNDFLDRGEVVSHWAKKLVEEAVPLYAGSVVRHHLGADLPPLVYP